MLDAVGFWSSTIQDDWRDDSALERLRALVAAQLEVLHEAERGARPEGILARDSRAGVGAAGRTICEATFLIPVVTPHYLRTKSCRDVFDAFRRRMERLGYDDLVFPIHYVDVDAVPEAATVFGEDLDVLRGVAWADFRPLVRADLDSAEVGRAAHDLAARIMQALRRPPRRPLQDSSRFHEDDRDPEIPDFLGGPAGPEDRRGSPSGSREDDPQLEIPAFLRRRPEPEVRPSSAPSPRRPSEGRPGAPPDDPELETSDHLRRQAAPETRSPSPSGPLGIDALLHLRAQAPAAGPVEEALGSPSARPRDPGELDPWAEIRAAPPPARPRFPPRQASVADEAPAPASPSSWSPPWESAAPPPPMAAPAEPPPRASRPLARRAGRGGVRLAALGLGLGAASALAWWAWRHHEAMGALVLKWIGGASTPLPPAEPPVDLVDISAYAPMRAAAGTDILVQVLLHRPEQAAQALGLAAEADPGASRRGRTTLAVRLPRFARVQVALDAPGLAIDEPVQTVFWTGEPAACQFLVSVPPGLAAGVRHLKVAAVVDGIPVGALRFALPVEGGVETAAVALRGDDATRYARAFLSYASADRVEVLKRAQSLKAARIGFFQDVLDLDPGERWEARLYEEIDRCDLFLLFWSSSAARSEWVLREVEYAVGAGRAASGGRIDVTPVILEGPPVPPPPDALRHIHFNDALRFVITAAERDAPPRA